MSSSASSPPAVLVDTCVISGIARNDMKPADAEAFCQMAGMVQRSELTIWASTVAREEIDKIPAEYRQAHVREYEALKTIRTSNATWIDTDPNSTGFGTVVEHSDYQTICGILKDENDARLVFQGKAGGVTDFVTVDYKSILNKTDELEQLGIRAVSPEQYIFSRSR